MRMVSVSKLPFNSVRVLSAAHKSRIVSLLTHLQRFFADLTLLTVVFPVTTPPMP